MSDLTLFLKYLEALYVFFTLLENPISILHSYILQTIRNHLKIFTFSNLKNCFLDENHRRQTPISLPLKAKWLISKLHLNAEYLLLSLEDSFLKKNLPADAYDFHTLCVILMSDGLYQSLHKDFQIIWSETQLSFILREVFKLPSFRHNQLKAIQQTLSSKPVIALFPTGYGKSLVYMIPCCVEYGITLLFSPLCSLITDQERRLQQLGINAVAIRAGLDNQTVHVIRRNLSMRFPPYSVVLLTPEKFLNDFSLRNLLHCLHLRGILRRIVFDECHTISLWGHSFRPSYIKLCQTLTNFNGANFLCLTATADGSILKDLEHLLHLKGNNVSVIRESFNRKNLQFIIKDKTKFVLKDCITLIKTNFSGKTGILYCTTCREADKISQLMVQAGIKAMPYHSKLDENLKLKAVELWMANVVQIICATIAFGLGIDKPNVRFIILHSIPSSAESYLQLCGRAGNDLPWLSIKNMMVIKALYGQQ